MSENITEFYCYFHTDTAYSVHPIFWQHVMTSTTLSTVTSRWFPISNYLRQRGYVMPGVCLFVC